MEDQIVSFLLGKFNNLRDLVMFFIVRLEQKNYALEFLKNKASLLEKNLENNKLFLNMVVHDMRNPTN